MKSPNLPIPRRTASYAIRYGLLGLLFGLLFPIVATVIEVLVRDQGWTLQAFIDAQKAQPLLWIIDTAPVILGLFAIAIGRRHGRLVDANTASANQLALLTKTKSELEKEAAEKEALKEQLMQSHKMEVVGRLAAGVAHDFNNLLSAIIGNAELLKPSLIPGSEEAECLSEIHIAGDRATALTQQLLTFSRREVRTPKKIGLNNLVFRERKLLKRLLGTNINLSVDLHPDVLGVFADELEISQVLLNLVVNARDSIMDRDPSETDGDIFVATNLRVVTSMDLPVDSPLKAGTCVELSVEDTGRGIPDEILEHIFEPFFTTKEQGEGTGLGLSTVYGIVNRCGGHIFVESEVGIGTRFRILFPQESSIHSSETSVHDESKLVGTETILLAEDEKSVRRLTKRILSASGYNVIEAEDPSKALAMFQAAPEKFDLLFSDIVMPGMYGTELAEKIREITPDLPCLFMSGYSENELVGSHRILLDGVNYLQKPFRPVDLREKLRSVLDQV